MTSRRWLTISLLIVGLASFARADDWRSLERRIQGKKPAEAARIFKLSGLYKDSDDLKPLSSNELVESIHQLARTEERLANAVKGQDAKATVKAIKKKAGIIDGRTSQQANWLADALERLKNLGFKMPEPEAPKGDFSGFSRIGVYLMWGLLGIGATVFLVFALRHLSKLQRRAVVKALIEDDEPERSVDEWLATADQLEKEGRYREAVRALYLASLIRLDEAGVARFLKHETNWEHQHRIQASPKRPPGLDMLPATRMMDRVWYGYRTQGAPDVAEMRTIYAQVMREAFAK